MGGADGECSSRGCQAARALLCRGVLVCLPHSRPARLARLDPCPARLFPCADGCVLDQMHSAWRAAGLNKLLETALHTAHCAWHTAHGSPWG